MLSSFSEYFIKEKGIFHKKLENKFNIKDYLFENKSILSFFTLVVLFNFLYSPFMVFLPVHLDNQGFNSQDLGFLLFVYAIGQLLSFLIIYLLKKEINSQKLIELSLILCPLMLFSLTLTDIFYFISARLLYRIN